MGFFSKNKNNGFIINSDDDAIKISGDKNWAPHAMTADEVSNLWVLGDDAQNHTQNSALDSLKKRMNIQPDEPKINVINLEDSKVDTSSSSNDFTKTDDNTPHLEPAKKTLIEKVKRYTVDEQGQDMSEHREPLYHLETVAEILMNDGESAIKNLSEKYGIDITLGNTNTADSNNKKSQLKTDFQAKPTTPFKQMVKESEKREVQERNEKLFGDNIVATQPTDVNVPDISDIDTYEAGITTPNDTFNTSTIRFTPIKDNLGNTDHITISSSTRHIDLGDDFIEDISSQSSFQSLEQSEFEKFTPPYEITDAESGKKVFRRLAFKKRSSFIGVSVSVLSVVALAIFLIPPVFDFIIANPKNAMFTCGAFLLIEIISNLSMFADLKNLVSKRCGFDALASLCSIFVLVLTLGSALTDSNAYYMILVCSLILLSRSICRFKEISSNINNLKQLIKQNDKKVVSLINDPATTFAMAKNSIEGDVLIAAPRNSNMMADYVKHTTFATKLSGKCSFIFWFDLVFSLLCGVISYFYYQTLFAAFYSASVVSCITALPTLFFIDSLPLYSASKRLNSKGSMIAGMYGAERLELTNAVVVNTNDIFPNGTIKLQSIKVLSNNNIDDTILRAASLTAAVGSPLEAIFNQIAGTNSSYIIPDSDTVKYEKNLGISGWVNNELLFIGNRSFMKAHGITIPSLEIDKKILRQGFFPVYVSNSDTACALIVIQYTIKPEIAKELRKITNLGLTLLIKNCDPNITEEMICDYFDLYEGSVKIMSNAGVHMLKNATLDVAECSAPAAYIGTHINLIKIINCASMIKRSNKLLTILYTLFAVLGIMYFIYASFSGLMSMPNASTVFLYTLGTSLLSIIGFLIRKP